MSLTKQNKSKNKTKNNNNKKRATKNGMQSHQLSKQHPLPILKKKSRDRSTKITVSLCFDVFNRIKF